MIKSSTVAKSMSPQGSALLYMPIVEQSDSRMLKCGVLPWKERTAGIAVMRNLYSTPWNDSSEGLLLLECFKHTAGSDSYARSSRIPHTPHQKSITLFNEKFATNSPIQWRNTGLWFLRYFIHSYRLPQSLNPSTVLRLPVRQMTKIWTILFPFHLYTLSENSI